MKSCCLVAHATIFFLMFCRFRSRLVEKAAQEIQVETEKVKDLAEKSCFRVKIGVEAISHERPWQKGDQMMIMMGLDRRPQRFLHLTPTTNKGSNWC